MAALARPIRVVDCLGLADQRPILDLEAAVQREEPGTGGIRQISTQCRRWRTSGIKNSKRCGEAAPLLI
jgi:hypothetical protein